MLTRLREARLVSATLMTLAGLLVLGALGFWQLARKAWKEQILAAVAMRSQEPPLSLAETKGLVCGLADRVGTLASCDYRRVRLSGTFDHARERHIFAGVQRISAGQMPGYWVFTPFLVEGAGPELVARPILVNRGFVPEPLKASKSRAEGQIAAPMVITAQIRSRQARQWSDGQSDTAKNIYYVRDPGELLPDGAPVREQGPFLAAGLFYLELVADAPPGGFPEPLAGHVELPNRHLEYALTWFGLAAALVAVYASFAVARLRGG